MADVASATSFLDHLFAAVEHVSPFALDPFDPQCFYNSNMFAPRQDETRCYLRLVVLVPEYQLVVVAYVLVRFLVFSDAAASRLSEFSIIRQVVQVFRIGVGVVIYQIAWR